MTVTVEDMRVMLNLDDDEGEKLLLIYIASATSFVKKAISTEADDAFLTVTMSHRSLKRR